MISNFYNNNETDERLYLELAPVYQSAFEGPPWNEVSKCVDQQEPKRCVAGLSPTAVGDMCVTCGECPGLPAYETEQLVGQFTSLEDRGAIWYTERVDDQIAMAAVAWVATPSEIAELKYQDVPEMKDWLETTITRPILPNLRRKLGLKINEPRIMWLDEVFSDRTLRPQGNLNNFSKFVVTMAEMLDVELVAYRTIEPRMINVAKRDFGRKARIFSKQTDMPDRRDFVMIDTMIWEEAGPALGAEVPMETYKKTRRSV